MASRYPHLNPQDLRLLPYMTKGTLYDLVKLKAMTWRDYFRRPSVTPKVGGSGVRVKEGDAAMEAGVALTQGHEPRNVDSL